MSSSSSGRTREEAAAARQHTMSLRALHRLGEEEVPALGVALGALVGVEAQLARDLGTMRRAAEREAQARRKHGVPGAGAAMEGYEAARQVLDVVTHARDSLFTAG